MWFPFQFIASLAAGLFNNFQQPFDISHGGLSRLTNNQFGQIGTHAEFARAAYCNPNKTAGWTCGAACNALPGFLPTLTGGDGDDTQFFFVGYWPTQSAVVVAHQGTDPEQILAIGTDANIILIPPDPTLFPGIPIAVEIHAGFANEHQITASQILEEVQRLMAKYSSTTVILIGHSLGGALAELDSLFMKLNLPAGTTVRGVTYGTPRVGNEDWSAFFDSQVHTFFRVNNKLDPVPVVPDRLFGYKHPSGEIHLQADGRVVVCPGPDNDVSPECSDQMVPIPLEGNEADHNGPYDGVLIGTQHCTP